MTGRTGREVLVRAPWSARWRAWLTLAIGAAAAITATWSLITGEAPFTFSTTPRPPGGTGGDLPADLLAVGLVPVVMAAVVLGTGPLLTRFVAGRDGILVVNGYARHRLSWAEVSGVQIGGHGPRPRVRVGLPTLPWHGWTVWPFRPDAERSTATPQRGVWIVRSDGDLLPVAAMTDLVDRPERPEVTAAIRHLRRRAPEATVSGSPARPEQPPPARRRPTRRYVPRSRS